MKPKYVVYPGKVISRTDLQEHYVGARDLMRLYGVEESECEIYEPKPWWPPHYHDRDEERRNGLIALRPRYDGNYSLPSNDQGKGRE